MKLISRYAFALVLVLVLGSLAFAQQEAPEATTRPGGAPGAPGAAERGPRGAGRGMMPGRGGPGAASRPSANDEDEPAPVSTDHQMTLEGQPFKYEATTGTLSLKDDQNKSRGKMFFVAYAKDAEPVADLGERPITFVFNGGPGAAAIWLHMGVGGPKRIVLPDDGAPPTPPYKLADNDHSWLDLSDLVFIDPIGTGYSRAEGDPQRAREFYGARGDLESVSDFIRIYCTKYRRWMSPKFLIGESYGTTRAAGLSEMMHDRYGLDLNGIVLISTVLNFQTLDFSAGNDTGYPLYLPSYAAIAHFHKKLPPELQQKKVEDVVREAQAFAMGDYSAALLKGTSLSDADRDKIAQQIARYSGLPIAYVKRSNLRISPFRYENELLADDERVIGRMDGRFTAHNADPNNDSPEFDPTLTGYIGVFANTFNDYVRRELKYENEQTYEFLSPRVGRWDFGSDGNGFYNVATTLRRCMTKMPKMKVMICSGWYDLATPFTAADYTVNQMPLSKELRSNLSQKYYEGGHMLYLNKPALDQLKRDLANFYGAALKK